MTESAPLDQAFRGRSPIPILNERSADMSMVDIKHGFVTARGVRYHVAEAGSGPLLVLLHGWPEFWATWEPIFARLASRYRLIAPDFRGFGESENPHLVHRSERRPPGHDGRYGAEARRPNARCLY